MAQLFGFQIQRATKEVEGGEKTFTTPTPDDGTVDVAGGGFLSSVLNTDGRERSDIDLIRRYRDISLQAECDAAIEDIVNESIVANTNDVAVEVVLDNLPYPDKIKKRIRDEFNEVLRLLDFGVKGHDIFRRWYVDGRIYYHKVIDTSDPKRGITQIRHIDPTKIKKVRETKKNKDPKTNVDMIEAVNEYFIYNDKGFTGLSGTGQATSQGIRIAKDAICYVPSGIIDSSCSFTISPL